MGKRGKAARKRRRENEVNTAALASKFIRSSSAAAAAEYQHDGVFGDGAEEEGNHGISDAALDTTIATLHRLCGLVDPATGKLALKDKRYRGLRKVLYELQNYSGGQPNDPVSLNSNTIGVNSLLNSEIPSSVSLSNISLSKITREISAQIENGAWELAVTTLRNVRKRQGEYSKQHQKDDGYLRPKLGSVQRWIRQIDAAGTDDPLALQVIDAILRVVAPEAIIPVEMGDLKAATWARLGVSEISSDGDGKCPERGRIRLFPPFDRRLRDTIEGGNSALVPQTLDFIEELVGFMKVGEDGIRRIPSPYLDIHREKLYRKCGYEKGADRKPPNKYDLELLTTAPIDETNDLETTFSGKQVLLDSNKELPVVKTPLSYVQDSFLLENVLSQSECNRLIAAAETAGYKPDEPLAGQPGASILAHACVWVVDHVLERTIFDRVKHFLPSYERSNAQKRGSDDIETFHPLGLNRRFRFYRYVPGRYYRPHIDGAWPKSGFDKRGKYRYDICDEENKNGLQFVEKEEGGLAGRNQDNGNSKQSNNINEEIPTIDVTNDGRRQLSRLTFLIYLNDDFDGGHTTFLVPAQDEEGILNAFPINPVRGGVLVFPHGTCAAPLHEGSPVLKRCKYVVRTEVEYCV